jgi:RNA polymerase sigma-70 factor (ECF subfamily)
MEFVNQLTGTEEIWIEQASRGDLDAFNQLVLQHQDLAYRHAYAMLNDQWLAEEAVQDSFLKAFQKLDGFRGGSFRAWLMRILTNTVYDVLRQSGRRPLQPLFPENDEGEDVESPAWMADPNVRVEEAVEWNEEMKLVYQVLDELPDIYRQIIDLVDLQEFGYEETAQILKVPVGTVKSRLARARMQMKESLRNKNRFQRRVNDAGLCLAM